MGKTTTPLHILVHPSLWGTPAIQALVEKGHTVAEWGDAASADLIVGPTCWRIVPELVDYLDDAIQAAQKVVKASKPKEKRHA